VTFTPAPYPDLVRDLLTWLTRGVAREPHPVPLAGLTELRFETPARRVSHVAGEVEGEPGTRTPYRFTERDFDLLPSEAADHSIPGVTFGKGRVPAPGSTVTVNYYPTRTPPALLNDVAAGSVIRLLLETFARALATQQEQLRLVYESAFVETAREGSLDKVAALVDVTRLKQRHPVGKVRLTRRPGSPGAVTIPVETAVTDGAGNRYLTTDPATMLPGQSTVEVWVHGESPSTEPVGPGALTVLERAIAGVDRPTNDEATFRATEDETDDQLRLRAQAAIHRAGRGTLDAIRSGLEALDFVSAVALTEQPAGIPGTLRVDVSLREDTPANRRIVERRVVDLRPAGIDAAVGFAGKLALTIAVDLTFAGTVPATSEVDTITAGVRERLVRVAGSLAPGAVLRKARLVAAVLEDARLVDAALSVTAGGAAVTGDTFTVPPNVAVQLDAGTDITFGPFASETGGPAAATTVPVDIRLRVAILDPGVNAAAVEARARTVLAAAVANAAALSVDTVSVALAAETAFVALAAQTQVAVETAPGQFTEITPGQSRPAPAGGSYELRDVTVDVAGGP